jgi:pyridoxine/pyridoxamine 5'-phosphate oxidase
VPPQGKQLAANCHAALTFWWEPLQRQVRVEGVVEQLPEEESEAYFHSRPRSHQVSGKMSSPAGLAARTQAGDEVPHVIVQQCVSLLGWLPEHDSCRAHREIAGLYPAASHLAVGLAELVCAKPQRPCSPCRALQIGALASMQSTPLRHGRQELEERAERLERQYADESVPVPRPPHWGGYVLRPLSIEFWQGRPSRLHDRLRYVRKDANTEDWRLERLAP